jgi:signal transduction histidine kinase
LTTNAKRHASSSYIQVDLSDRIISISDNGIGGNLNETTGYGLVGIKERLQLIGAELFINLNSSGTRAEIRFM